MFEWLKSTRSIAVVIVLMTLSIALFMNKVDPKDYMVIASAIVTAYFGKRDSIPNEPSN